MSATDLTIWLQRWQGVASLLAVIGTVVTALMIYGRAMQRLDVAEQTIREVRTETVSRREFELLLKGIDDLRVEIRSLRDTIQRGR